jgi:hypothetical protein
MKSIDWEGKGDISREIHQFIGERIDLINQEDELTDFEKGLLAAYINIKNFIEG